MSGDKMILNGRRLSLRINFILARDDDVVSLGKSFFPDRIYS